MTHASARRLTLGAVATIATAAALAPGAQAAAGTQRTAAGPNAAAIQAAVDAFRADLGGVNNGNLGTFPGGRREINWDAVPDSASDPNPFAGGGFLNRGALFATPGTGFRLSADSANPTTTPPVFSQPGFKTFSAERLFAPVGSTTVDAHFFLPGTGTPASVKGFGVVFTDVDTAGSAKIELLDAAGAIIDTVVAPAAPDGLSFVGDSFADARAVARVRITSGNTAVTGAAEAAGTDIVGMDDFLYGEPQAGLALPVPPPAPGGGGTPGGGGNPPAPDRTAPRAKLGRLAGGGVRFLLASDERGTFKAKLSARGKTLARTGTRTLRAGGTTLTLRPTRKAVRSLRRARVRPTLTVVLKDAAGNARTLRTKIKV